MKQVTLDNGVRVEIFDDISQMPMSRYHAFNKAVLYDTGIGSDINDTDKRLSGIKQMIAKGDYHDAGAEIDNLRQNIAFIIMGINPKNLAFASLVHKVNSKECNDLSTEGLQRTLAMLEKASTPQSWIDRTYDEVKKKLTRRLRSFFRGSRTKPHPSTIMHI